MNRAQREERFAEHYHTFVDLTIPDDAVEREAAGIAAAVAEHGGHSVLVLACGTGRYAIELGRRGFDVTGLDPLGWAVGRAVARQRRSAVAVQFRVADSFDRADWPTGRFDAAVYVTPMPWATPVDHLALLRRARLDLHLAGVLLCRFPDIRAWAPHGTTAQTADGNVRYSLQYRPCAGGGDVEGHLTVRRRHGQDEVYPFPVRCYSERELSSLIRPAGFDVQRAGAGFRPAPTVPSSRTLHVVARAVERPPDALAVASWNVPSAAPLDLRYAPDEAGFLDTPPDTVWREVLAAEERSGTGAIGHYPVDDPYGGVRGAPVLSDCFAAQIAAGQVTFGPGVTSLLKDLAGLSDGAAVVTGALNHPDLPAWAASRGCRVVVTDAGASIDRTLDAVQHAGASLIHVDRPVLWAGLQSLRRVRELAGRASDAGAIVVIDESAATYLGPAASAVTLLGSCTNLVVLRGFTKAYSWGGARVAFATASPAIASRVRQLVAPLQVNEMAFRAALRLLSCGDIFARLRARIRAVKPTAREVFDRAGLDLEDPHPELPWLIAADPSGSVSARLERLGIRGLRPSSGHVPKAARPDKLLLFAPLSDGRMQSLRERLSADPVADGPGGSADVQGPRRTHAFGARPT